MRFSIIIPVYNTERYLSKCLDSILSQSFADFEVICVDDGSTDGSVSVLKTYAERDERVKLLYSERGGVSKARNLALAKAVGEYILYVDSDDWILPGALDVFDREITENHPDMLVFASKRYLEGDDRYVENPIRNLIDYESGSEYYSYAANDKLRDSFGNIWGKCFCSTAIKKNGIFFCEDISYHEDTLFVIDVCSCAGKVKGIPDIFYVYRIRQTGSLMTTVDNRRYRDMAFFANILSERYLCNERLPYVTICRMISSYYRNSLIWGGCKVYRMLRGMIDWVSFRKTSLVSMKAMVVYYGLRILPFVVIPVLSYRNDRQIVKLRRQDHSI